jgi:DNA-directed RNA polymerase specialized sigma24 family protein
MSDTWVIEESTASLARLDEELRAYLRDRGRANYEIDSLVSRTWISAGRVFEGRCSLRRFLYLVMRRQVQDYDRATKARPWLESERDLPPDELPTDASTFDSELANLATAERARDALARIPSHYAEVVELVLKGYGHLTISDKLGLEYNTVRSRYSRGKALLLALLKDDDSDNDDS